LVLEQLEVCVKQKAIFPQKWLERIPKFFKIPRFPFFIINTLNLKKDCINKHQGSVYQLFTYHFSLTSH
jgi:hypothetical protein